MGQVFGRGFDSRQVHSGWTCRTLYVILSYTGIRFVWCIEENKSNGIVCCESDIQCRYFLWYNSDMNWTNWYVNNRCQDREKNSLPSIDSCPFLWTAHRFLPIEQNRVTPADTVWGFNRFPSSWFYQRFYALGTDSIIYSKIVTCLIEWRVHLISLHSGGCFSVFKFLRSNQQVVSSKR